MAQHADTLHLAAVGSRTPHGPADPPWPADQLPPDLPGDPARPADPARAASPRRWCWGTWVTVISAVAWLAFVVAHALFSGRHWLWLLPDLAPPLVYVAVP